MEKICGEFKQADAENTPQSLSPVQPFVAELTTKEEAAAKAEADGKSYNLHNNLL